MLFHYPEAQPAIEENLVAAAPLVIPEEIIDISELEGI